MGTPLAPGFSPFSSAASASLFLSRTSDARFSNIPRSPELEKCLFSHFTFYGL